MKMPRTSALLVLCAAAVSCGVALKVVPYAVMMVVAFVADIAAMDRT